MGGAAVRGATPAAIRNGLQYLLEISEALGPIRRDGGKCHRTNNLHASVKGSGAEWNNEGGLLLLLLLAHSGHKFSKST